MQEIEVDSKSNYKVLQGLKMGSNHTLLTLILLMRLVAGGVVEEGSPFVLVSIITIGSESYRIRIESDPLTGLIPRWYKLRDTKSNCLPAIRFHFNLFHSQPKQHFASHFNCIQFSSKTGAITVFAAPSNTFSLQFRRTIVTLLTFLVTEIATSQLASPQTLAGCKIGQEGHPTRDIVNSAQNPARKGLKLQLLNKL
ncbi:hypothetical protein RHMOL_Rhmol11G0229700 [Rhododendron molle]|uniref:Uncharacterized protein n=1 Tax=Rhododendron molle TaxID=49168 RepID=A0ACC0LWF7_RHOML|nr:hypothetical protein RHMOL_Rhmol11G0229700 [Rhododendron molle]